MAKKKVEPRKRQRLVISVLMLLVWTAASVIASQLFVGMIMIFLLGKGGFSQPVWTAVYSALSYVVALFLIVVAPVVLLQKLHEDTDDAHLPSRTTMGLKDLPTWTDIGLAPVGFLAYLLLAGFITYIFMAFPWFDIKEAQDVGFSTYIVGWDRIVAFITLVIVAPIAEELIFRGWLYGKMREKLNNKVSNNLSMIISIFLVSLLFGILHMQWNVGVNVFAMSIVLCGLREITGTVYSGIILHMLKNAIAFYALYILGITG